jgi:hypothetical protein
MQSKYADDGQRAKREREEGGGGRPPARRGGFFEKQKKRESTPQHNIKHQMTRNDLVYKLKLKGLMKLHE